MTVPFRELIKIEPAEFSELGVAEEDYTTFVKLIEIIKLQSEGTNVIDACKSVGMARSTFYTARIRRLMDKARQVVLKPAIMMAQSAATYVYEEWPEVVKSMVWVSKNSNNHMARVKAAEVLGALYIANQMPSEQGESQEIAYMLKPKNFNNMTPIQVNEGGTIIINQAEDPK